MIKEIRKNNEKTIGKKILKKAKGITLISLVITIIILLILAGVTINLTIGENGIFRQATKAGEEYSKAEAKEKVSLLLTQYGIEKATNQSSDFANFLRKNLQVGVAQNEDNTYSFILDKWQIVTNEDEVISIEEFKLDVDKTYPNVASMKADTELTDGQLVQTESYWDKQYGGSAYYDIVSSTSLTVDEGKCIQLDNALYAELHPINDTVTVNQFGAYGDGEHDDAGAIQLAWNAGYDNVTFESEKYMTDNIITLQKSNVNIIGNQTTISMRDEFNIPINYFIYVTGTEDNPLNNINLYNLSIETGKVVRSFNDAVQLMVRYVNGLEISGCNFSVSQDIDNHVTNIWMNGSTSNATIYDNNFINLSNSDAGGNIWITEQTDNITKNIKIYNNYIEKSSHDESIAIWHGNVEDIVINNNTFNIHEENVENPSDVNFTIGNDEEDSVFNVKFTNNKIDTQTKRMIFSISSPSNKENEILIENNHINCTFVQKMGDISLFNNKTENNNFLVNNNNINISAKYEDDEFFSLSRGSASITSNNIVINNNVHEILRDIKDIKLHNNNITVNNSLAYFAYNVEGTIKDNLIEINGGMDSLLAYGTYHTLLNDVEINNNSFNINDTEIWATNSKNFCLFFASTINNHGVSITNNTIHANNQTNNQSLVWLVGIHDENIQTIHLEKNNYGIFKRVGNYDSLIPHEIIVDGKVITNTTLLE